MQATKRISADTVVFQGALCEPLPLGARTGPLHQEVLLDLPSDQGCSVQDQGSKSLKLGRSSINIDVFLFYLSSYPNQSDRVILCCGFKKSV